MTAFDVSPIFRPVLDSAAEYRREWGTIEASIEELIDDVELLQLKLEEKSLALTESQQQLADEREQLNLERTENRRLLQLLEQQDARLSETLTELRRLSCEQHQLQEALVMAAESSLVVSEDVRESQSHALSTSSAAAAELASELKEVRKLLEEQAARHNDVPAVIVPSPNASQSMPAANAPAAAAAEESANNNPVVNSVMAQFAKLQKDVAQRKKRR